MEATVPLTAHAPGRTLYRARLADAPHYKGSFHDDAVARAMGYQRALVPGAFVLAAMSHLAVATWGQDWLHRGTIAARFTRPCYDGDPLEVTATPLHDSAATLTVTRPGNEAIATGTVALPQQPPDPPDPAEYPVLPLPQDPPPLEPGAMRPGTPLGSHDAILTPEDHAKALADFGETWPPYRDSGIVPVGRLMRVIMRDTNRNFRLPTPVILTACAVRNLAPVHAGQRVATAGTIAATWERKGNHYYESRHLLTADGRPAGLFSSTMIYASRGSKGDQA